MNINTSLVKQLVQAQFPQWADLKITSVEKSGWDNRTFHLGKTMSVRLPSSAIYAPQVKKEQYWLPKLQTELPLKIPKPIDIGKPSKEFPWHWSIYEWLVGETVSETNINDLTELARELAGFLKALQQCDITNAPAASADNFYRGGDLHVYDRDTRLAIANLEDKLQANTFLEIWETALKSQWKNKLVWVHGDISVGNLLVHNGTLNAVIDFGQLAVGDPACDLALYWTFFSGKSQGVFKETIDLDFDTWSRARGWVLWKTLCSPVKGTDSKRILESIMPC